MYCFAGPFGERPEASKSLLADILEDPTLEGAGAAGVLHLDVDAAFDRIKPSKSKVVSVLYRKDRYEKDWDDGLGDGIHPEHHLDNADHLGGSWFQGMAEVIDRRTGGGFGNFLNFDKMVGRDDGDDGVEERLLLGEGSSFGVKSKGRNGQYNLDLDPKWELMHPKEAKVDLRMRSPETYPRFKDDLKVNSHFIYILLLLLLFSQNAFTNYFICRK